MMPLLKYNRPFFFFTLNQELQCPLPKNNDDDNSHPRFSRSRVLGGSGVGYVRAKRRAVEAARRAATNSPGELVARLHGRRRRPTTNRARLAQVRCRCECHLLLEEYSFFSISAYQILQTMDTPRYFLFISRAMLLTRAMPLTRVPRH